MVAHRTLSFICVVLISIASIGLAAQYAPIHAASTPPDLLTPRTIQSCTKANDESDACFDGTVSGIDASIDGQVALFVSDSNRFVPADQNRFADVFLWRDGSVQRVSIGANGEEGNQLSDRAALSGNGRYVYFRSFADSLVNGTLLGRANLYLKDVTTGELALISRDIEGVPVNGFLTIDHFDHIDVDYSGRYVVFASSFANFVAGVTDNNDTRDVFLADVDPDGNGDYFDSAPRFYLLSALADGITPGNGRSFEPSIAQDGRGVVWLTRATDLASGLASNGVVADVVLARFGTLPDGTVDPGTRTLVAINRMGDGSETLTPTGARLARIDPWRDQVAFVTADTIPGSGDDHSGQDVYLSVGNGEMGGDRHLVWMSHAYNSSEPNALSVAWDPKLPPGALSQVAWVAQDAPRSIDDLLLQRDAPFYPTGWSTVNWAEAATPSNEPVGDGVLSADGRFALWTTTESYGLDVPADSLNLYRRAIAPAQSVALTVEGVGGGANYAPIGVPLQGTMFYSPTTVVTLTPQADVGYRFQAWQGVDSREGMTATVIVYAARTVTASFEAMTPPVAGNLSLSTAEETTLQGIALTITDPDPDEQHTVTLAQSASHGSVTLLNNAATYQPATNFSGQDEFLLQVTDAYGLQLAAPARVTVNVTPVGDAPTAADLALTVAEDTRLPNITLVINDPDANELHTLSVIEPPTHGTAILLNNVASYQPSPNFNGQDMFTLQVTDRDGLQLAAPARVTVQVIPVNDAPTASDLALTVAEDTRLTDIALTIHDADSGDTHTVTLAKVPTNGTANLLSNIASYQPAPNFNGQDEFTLQVTDGAGAQLATPARVAITVTPVNDAPTVASAQGSGANNGAAIPVFVTVQDPDAGDSYTLAIETPPTAGGVQINAQLQAEAAFAYTPHADFVGVDSFTFRATDTGNASIVGTASVTVTAPSVVPPIPTELHLPALHHSP